MKLKQHLLWGSVEIPQPAVWSTWNAQCEPARNVANHSDNTETTNDPCRNCQAPFNCEICDELPKADNINHPPHYTGGGIETIDYIEAKGFGYHLGNAVKYISRAGKKHSTDYVEDLKKAEFYIKREIERAVASSTY